MHLDSCLAYFYLQTPGATSRHTRKTSQQKHAFSINLWTFKILCHLPAQPWFAVVHKSNHISGIGNSCKCKFSCAHVIHCKILNAFRFLIIQHCKIMHLHLIIPWFLHRAHFGIRDICWFCWFDDFFNIIFMLYLRFILSFITIDLF